MKKSDIKNIGDIMRVILENHGEEVMKAAEDTGASEAGGSEAGGSEVTVEQLYSYGPEKLRANHFTSQGAKYAFPQFTEDGSLDPGILGDSNIVLFFTKKISDNENDLLHNASGPAVIFNKGGEGNEYFFIDGTQVDPSSKEFRAAKASMTYSSDVGSTGEEADLGGFDYFG